jgi:hypothetical protein
MMTLIYSLLSEKLMKGRKVPYEWKDKHTSLPCVDQAFHRIPPENMLLLINVNAQESECANSTVYNTLKILPSFKMMPWLAKL